MKNKLGSKRLGSRMQKKAIAIRTRLQPPNKLWEKNSQMAGKKTTDCCME